MSLKYLRYNLWFDEVAIEPKKTQIKKKTIAESCVEINAIKNAHIKYAILSIKFFEFIKMTNNDKEMKKEKSGLTLYKLDEGLRKINIKILSTEIKNNKVTINLTDDWIFFSLG